MSFVLNATMSPTAYNFLESLPGRLLQSVHMKFKLFTEEFQKAVFARTPVGKGSRGRPGGTLKASWTVPKYERGGAAAWSGSFSFENATYVSRSGGKFYYGYLWEFGADPATWIVKQPQRGVKHGGRWFSSQAVGGMISPLLPQYEKRAADVVSKAVEELLDYQSQGFLT